MANTSGIYNSTHTGNSAQDLFGRIWIGIFTLGISEIVIACDEKKIKEEKAEQEYEARMKTYSYSGENKAYITGASNAVATGESQPFFCGRVNYTPYLMQEPYYSCPAYSNSHFNRTPKFYSYMELGFPSLVLKKVKAGDVVLKTFTDEEPQDGVYSISTGKYSGQIEIKQKARFTTLSKLNYKTSFNSLNTSDFTNDDGSIAKFDIDPKTKKTTVTLHFPDGLQYSQGFTRTLKIKITVWLSDSEKRYIHLDGVTTFTDNTNSFNTTKTMSQNEFFMTGSYTFSLSDFAAMTYTNPKISISYTTKIGSGAPSGSSFTPTIVLTSIQSECFDPMKSSKPAGILEDNGTAGLVNCLCVEDRELDYTTNVAVELNAKENDVNVGNFTIEAGAIARVWNSSTHTWSNIKSETSNPAAWALEILTSSVHPLSQYDDDEIDLEAFGEWYEFCEDRGYKFDYTISKTMSKSSILDKICTAGDGYVYQDFYLDKITVGIDKSQMGSIACYNSQNILSISNKKSFGRRVDGVKVTYKNADADFKSETEYIMRNGIERTSDSVLTSLTLEGICTHDHVVKFVRKYMASLNLRTKNITLAVGPEAVAYPLLKKVIIQTDSLKVGISNGVIDSVITENGYITGLVLRDSVTFEEDKNYGILVNCISGLSTAALGIRIAGTGRTKEVELVTPLEFENAALIPEAGAIFSFGELDDDNEFSKISSPFLILSKQKTDKGYTLNLVEYNEAVYDATGTIPDYKSNITENSRTTAPEEKNFVTPKELEVAVQSVDVVDEYGNLTITNSDVSPKMGVYIGTGHVYNLNGNQTDEDGNNSENLTFNGDYDNDVYLDDEGQSFNGTIEKDINGLSRDVVILSKADKLWVCGKVITNAGEICYPPINDVITTNSGLTQTQINSKIFKWSL